MIEPNEYIDAKTAFANGATYFISPFPCKNGHLRPIRRVLTSRGIGSRCEECSELSRRSFENKEYYKENRKLASKKWRDKNRDKKAEWYISTKHERPFFFILNSIRSRCKANNLPFDLDEEYLHSLIPEDGLCPIMKTKLVFGSADDSDRNCWISVDRIRPDNGYIKGNIAIISCYANLIKQNCIDPLVFRNLADWLDNILITPH